MQNHISILRSRKALLITETELKAMAAPAIIGLGRKKRSEKRVKSKAPFDTYLGKLLDVRLDLWMFVCCSNTRQPADEYASLSIQHIVVVCDPGLGKPSTIISISYRLKDM